MAAAWGLAAYGAFRWADDTEVGTLSALFLWAAKNSLLFLLIVNAFFAIQTALAASSDSASAAMLVVIGVYVAILGFIPAVLVLLALGALAANVEGRMRRPLFVVGLTLAGIAFAVLQASTSIESDRFIVSLFGVGAGIAAGCLARLPAYVESARLDA